MGARSMGSGILSFGMVSIPFKLYASSDSTGSVKFNYLSPDGSRLRQQYVKAESDEVVAREDMLKGYEYAKGQYVTFTAEELKDLQSESDNMINIKEFVPVSTVDRIYVDKSYYLGPGKGGDRSYHLFRTALAKTDKVAVAEYNARGKSHVVVVRPEGDGLVMEQLKYQEDLRTLDDVPLGKIDVDDQELDLAVKIIEGQSTKTFDPGLYKDVVKERILNVVQQKIDGNEAIEIEDKRVYNGPVSNEVVNLMEALKASVG